MEDGGEVTIPVGAPTVSVVIPVKNRADLLREALDGLSKQAFRDFEVVVVDNGSTDGSGDVAREPRDIEVRVIRTGGGRVAIARNAGVAAARGTIIAFTDSDCVPDPDWLAEGVAAMESAGVDVAQGATVPTGPVGPFERSMSVLHEDGLYPTCNMFFRKSAFEAVGGFDLATHEILGFREGTLGHDLGFGEDTLTAWRARERGGSVFVPSAVVAHQVMPMAGKEQISRAWLAAGFPPLFKEHPEMKGMLGVSGFFLGYRRLPLYAFVLALLSRRRWLVLASALWWLFARARDVNRQGGSRAKRAAAVPVEMGIDVVTAAGLASGSARTGKVLL
jgi:glycosyltransferase involved in cell wall biosynthesis